MFRKCPKHGWQATSEYTVADDGEPVCAICMADPDNCGREGAALIDYTHTAPNGVLQRAKSQPRDKFVDALNELGHDTERDTSVSTTPKSSPSDIGPLFGDDD